MGLFRWIKKRAKEPSTYAGVGTVLAGVATTAGKPELAADFGPYLALLLSALGGILIAKPAPEPDSQGILPLR